MQSDSIIEMLKDFTALYILTELDDILFLVADYGFFGQRLARTTKKAKQIEFLHDYKKVEGLFGLRVLSLLIIIQAARNLIICGRPLGGHWGGHWVATGRPLGGHCCRLPPSSQVTSRPHSSQAWM